MTLIDCYDDKWRAGIITRPAAALDAHAGGEWADDGHFVIGWDDSFAPDEADVRRIVDCVNGCAGIRDPGSVGELLRKAKSVIRRLLDWEQFMGGFEAGAWADAKRIGDILMEAVTDDRA